ncbi:hypothetical protein T4C_6768 [Trichinella pseudospiralis]|uniref:Uncharacterized protein n=1 Tax=Trichinella pseudospiralis TaxID=6337 RepID=A0A0V1ITW9_TRIPS|nr:hypothetical protein T4C_6768 [Trichinella pseudospiralis]
MELELIEMGPYLTEAESSSSSNFDENAHQIIWINFRTALIASSTSTSDESLDTMPTRVAAAESKEFACKPGHVWTATVPSATQTLTQNLVLQNSVRRGDVCRVKTNFSSQKSFKNLFTFCLLCFCDDQNSVENVYDIEDDQATFAIILDYINSIHSTADLMFRKSAQASSVFTCNEPLPPAGSFVSSAPLFTRPSLLVDGPVLAAAFPLLSASRFNDAIATTKQQQWIQTNDNHHRCHKDHRSNRNTSPMIILGPTVHLPDLQVPISLREAQQLLVVGLRLLHTVETYSLTGEIYVGRQPGRERSVVAINVVKSIGESNQQLPTVSYIPKRKKCVLLLCKAVMQLFKRDYN